MKACVECRTKANKKSKVIKDEIFKEIREFLKDPDSYYVTIDPQTKFYKFTKS